MLVQTRIADDPVAQDVAARRLITDAFAPAQVRIQQTLVSEPRPVAGHDGRLVAMAGQALLSTDERFAELIDVVAGTWPSSPRADGSIGGALHRGAAERYGVGVGDTLVVDDSSVVVEAVWQPVDPQAAFWFGDPQVVTGVVDTQVGPLVVHPDAITQFGDTPFTRWTVQPDPGRIEPDDLPLLAEAAATLDRTMATPEVAVRGMTVEGDLAPTTATAGRQLATARALNVIPVVLLLLVSVIAVVQIARMQAAARAAEVELFIARGASRRQVLTWSLLESVVVATLATALGVGLALGLMRLVPAGEQPEPVVVRAGLAAGLAVLAALAAISVLQVRAVARRSLTDRSGRTGQVALGTLVLTVGAAALAWWQLRRYGSPLVVTADGERHTDLLAGGAPALLLAACAVLSMALLAPLGRVVEALTRPSRRLTGHLAASQVSRRLVVYAVPVVLTVLATGATTVASLYAATSVGLRDDLAALGQGAQVRADLADQPEDGSTIASVPDVSGVTGVTGSAPVWQTDSRVGSTPAVVTMLPVSLLEEVALLPETGLDAAATRAAIGAKLAPTDDPQIPPSATSLTIPVTMRLTPDPGLAAELQAMTDQSAATMRQTLEEVGLPEEEILAEIARERRFIFESYAHPRALPISLLLWDPATTSVHTVEAGWLTTTLDVGYVGGGTEEEPDASPIEVYARESTAREELTAFLPAPGEGRQVRGLTVALPQLGVDYDATVTIDGVLTDDGTDLLAEEGAGSWRALEPLPPTGSRPTMTQSRRPTMPVPARLP